MSASRVYGPYKARKGYRLVVAEAQARKSIMVPSIEAGAQLRADLEHALRAGGDRSLADALSEYQDYLQRVRGAVTAAPIASLCRFALPRFASSRPPVVRGTISIRF